MDLYIYTEHVFLDIHKWVFAFTFKGTFQSMNEVK